jgi:predicted small secreted protein
MKPKPIALFTLLVLAAASLSACAGLPFIGGFS